MITTRNRGRKLIIGLIVVLVIVGLLGLWVRSMVHLPGTPRVEAGDPGRPAATSEERDVADELERHLEVIASRFGERNIPNLAALNGTASYIEGVLAKAGYDPKRQPFEVDGVRVFNIEATLEGSGSAGEILVIGAHYDSVKGSPGINDNGTGVAATLFLAEHFAALDEAPFRTIRFVFFVNEEPPYFKSKNMGSVHYAAACAKAGDNIVGMISLETIGYYTDEQGSQEYPSPFSYLYPTTGDFVGFVGNSDSRKFLHRVVRTFRKHASIASEGLSAPESVPGVGWSDHWAFWAHGWPAIMVTDTAIFRYPWYHLNGDTIDKIEYVEMARVVVGMMRVIEEIV